VIQLYVGTHINGRVMSGCMLRLLFQSKQAIIFHFVLSPDLFVQSCNHG